MVLFIFIWMWVGVHPVWGDAHPDCSRESSHACSRNGDDLDDGLLLLLLLLLL